MVNLEGEKGGERMKKKIMPIFVAILTLGMFVLPMSMVYAKNNPKFIDVSGQLIVQGGGTHVVTPAGKSHTVKRSITGNALMWTGSFEDSISIADGNWVHHKEHNTLWNIHRIEAEFMDKSGTITIISTMGGWRIISGTGDFTNCHGKGTIWPITPPIVWGYEGQIHFDP